MFATVKLSVSICQPNFFLVLSPYIMFLHYLNKYNDSSFQHIKYCFNKFAAVTFSAIQVLYPKLKNVKGKETTQSSLLLHTISPRIRLWQNSSILSTFYRGRCGVEKTFLEYEFKLYFYFTTTYGKVTMNYAARISTVTIYVCLFIVLKLLTKAARRVKVVNRKRNGASSSKYNWPTRKRCKKVLL